MRKIKSTALLSAFVAVASLGAISHEAHGAKIVTPNNTPPIISKELLPSQVSLQASVIPTDTLSSGTITITISGASFLPGSYTISSAGPNATSCYDTISGVSNTLTFSGCSVTASSTYQIATLGGGPLNVTVPTSSSSIVLSYSANTGDTATSAIAYVQQQLTVTPASVTTYNIDPTSLSTFTNGSNAAANSVSILNNALNNNAWSTIYQIINSFVTSSTMIFSFSGIPSSVSSVLAADGSNSSISVTPGNASATISFVLAGNKSPYSSFSLDTINFTFSNSGNIQPGTIVLSSITGVVLNPYMSSYINYPYLSTPQNFLTFAIAGTQLYVPDALAPDNNAIQHGYITISMPSSASIASISVLNVPSASCPAPSTSNGLLKSTSTPGVYYIDLGQLAQACTGLSASAWQSGVPLVINIANAVPTQVTADAYAVFENMLKRIPVDVLNASNSNANFNY